MPRVGVSRSKACVSCIRGKRKCDLEQPSCGRCASRGAACVYPSTRLHATSRQSPDLPTVFSESGQAVLKSFPQTLDQIEPSPVVQRPPNNHTSHSLLSLANEAPSAPVSNDCHSIDQALTAPDSWQIYKRHAPIPEESEDIATLEAAVKSVQDWLWNWVIEGSTPFIHWRTCTEHTPPSIVNAYTSCATYFASTKSTKSIALRLIEQHVDTLMDGSMMGKVKPSCALEVHLTRVQALLVYQTIRLYDGDIRSRAQAEKTAPTLTRWTMEMLDCALQSSQYVHTFSPQQSRTLNDTEAWHAWILAESVRRTWVTCSIVQNTYFLLKGEEAYCPGHVVFTARTGLWGARSAADWMNAHRGRDPLFYDHSNGVDLFDKATREEVDDYALWAWRCSAGVDVVEWWKRKV